MKISPTIPAMSTQVVANVVIAGISFGLIIILARLMGPVLFGQYNFVISIAALFMIIQDGGFKNIIYRERTKPTYTAREAQQTLPLGLGHLVISTGIGIAACLMLPISGELKLTLAISISCFGLVVCASYVSSVFRALGKFELDALWQLKLRIVSAVLILGTLFLFSSYPWAIFLSWSLGTCICLLTARKSLSFPIFKPITRTPFASACISFMFISASTTIYHRIDIIMLEAIKGAESVGQYAAAYRFLDGFILLATPVGIVLFRKFRKISQDRHAVKRWIVKYSMMLLAVAIGIFVLFFFFSNHIILITYGNEYRNAALLLPLLFVALVFILPNGVLTQAVIAENKERAYAIVSFFCALINALLNGIAIPIWGGLGAAGATVVTEALLTFFLLIILRRAFNTR